MKLFFVSLGCDKNLVDSEMMLGMLSEHGIDVCPEGITFTDDEAEADIIIVNTCCFIGDAKEESIQTILEMAEYKETGSLKALIVTGCLAERYQKEIEEEIPEADAILGTNSYDGIVEAIRTVLAGERFRKFRELEEPQPVQKKRVLTTGGHYAYLKIAEGCDKRCTYCVIPRVRGRYRSIPMEVLEEHPDVSNRPGAAPLAAADPGERGHVDAPALPVRRDAGRDAARGLDAHVRWAWGMLGRG